MGTFVDSSLNVVHPSGWVHGGIQYPARIFREWDDSKLSAVGIYRVVYEDYDIPEGKQVAGYTYTIEGNIAKASPVFEDIPEIIPERVSKAQGKAVLFKAGLWDDVLAYVDTLEGEDRVMADIALNDTQWWMRDSPFLNQAASAIGVSDSQMDDLFLQASKIEI